MAGDISCRFFVAESGRTFLDPAESEDSVFPVGQVVSLSPSA